MESKSSAEKVLTLAQSTDRQTSNKPEKGKKKLTLSSALEVGVGSSYQY